MVKTSQHEFRVMQSQRVQTNERKGKEEKKKRKKGGGGGGVGWEFI